MGEGRVIEGEEIEGKNHGVRKGRKGIGEKEGDWRVIVIA